MTEFGIIFIHHSTGPTTANNLKLLRQFNPDAEIVTISQGGQSFPGGYNTRNLFNGPWRGYRQRLNEYGWRSLIRSRRRHREKVYTWRNAELAIYQWYSQKREHAKRWIVAEWDTFCCEPATSFFRDVWDSDVSGVNIHQFSRGDSWPHFSQEGMSSVPEEYREIACGISPIPGMLLSDEALGKISRFVMDDIRFRGVFCELRMGTASVACGYRPIEQSVRAKHTLSDVLEYKSCEINPNDGGWWHKVKDHHPLVAVEHRSGYCANPQETGGF
jgi:hypothetical protein